MDLLADDVVEVAVTSRNRSGISGSVHYRQGDAQDMNFLSDILREPWDAIVDFMVYDVPTFDARLKMLLEATKQYVFISSARVYADSGSPIIEDSPRLLDVSTDKAFLATNEYALTKARQENLLRQSGGSNWTIVRPYITYGEARFQLGVLEKEAWLYRALKGRAIVFCSDIAKRQTTLTYGRDVSRGIKALIGQSGALGEVFHITANNPVTWEKVMSVYLNVLERHLGYRPKIILQDLPRFQQVHSAEYQIRYDRLFHRVFDNAKICQYLDTSTFVAPEAGLERCLEAFLAAPMFNAIHWRSEAAKDRQTGEYSLSEISKAKVKLKYFLFRHFIN